MMGFASLNPSYELPSRTPHACHRGNVAMRFAADIVFEPHVVALSVDEARLPIAAVVVGIVNGDDDLELGRAGLTNALDRAHLVGVRRPGGVDESLCVEAGGLDHQRIALEMTDRMAVVEREADQLLLPRQRL